MQATGEEDRNVSDAQKLESKQRQVELLSLWVMNECEKIGGEIVDPDDGEDVLVEVPHTTETREQVKRIAGMMSVLDEIRTQGPLSGDSSQSERKKSKKIDTETSNE